MLTMIVNTAGAIIGNILGYTALKYIVVGLYYHSYSLPRYTTVWSGKAFLSTTILPFSYITLKLVLKILMMNYNGWITAYIAPWVYAAVMGLGAASYGIVHILEMRRINRIPLAEALKDTE